MKALMSVLLLSSLAISAMMHGEAVVAKELTYEEKQMVYMCESYFNVGPRSVEYGGALPGLWKKRMLHRDCMELKEKGQLKINDDSWINVKLTK